MRPKGFSDILSRLPHARKSGDCWTASCPAPGHSTPAQHLTLKDVGDKALATCQGGRHTYQDICQALGFDSLTYSPNGNGPESEKQKILVATFSYEYEKGREAYQMRRFDLGNGSKTFEAWHKKDGNYVSGMGEYKNKPILYHSPEIVDWIAIGKRIYIPEGELKADRIISKGGAATTSPFGAGRNKWRPKYAETLAGAEAVTLPDNDKPGRDFVQDKAASLYGIAKSVKVLELSGLPEKGDIIDWFNAGGTFEQLERLADACPNYEPPDNERTQLRRMADVQAESVSWLWHPYIPKGKPTLLEGDPGVGKSWLSLAIATAVSLGRGLPGKDPGEPAAVVIASAEDGPGDTIRPRLDAMGADVSLIFAVDGALTLDENGFAVLESYLEKVRPALLIIDPLVAYLGAGVDIHRANETRAVMSHLARIADKFGVAILAVRHLTKGGMSKAIYRGLGSIDFTAACRSVLLAGCDPENPQKKGLVHIKSNLAPTGSAIGYELRDGGFYWTGETELTAARILAAEDGGEGKSAIDEAVDFLRDELTYGPVEAKQVFSDAKSLGIYERTLNRAKSKLRVTSKREGESGKRGIARVKWQLPEDLEGQKDLGCQDCHIEDIGNVNQIILNNSVTPLGVGNVNTPEAVLGMPVEKAIEIWRSEGAPIIYLEPGENCSDLEKLLHNPATPERHLRAVRAWLQNVAKP